MSNTLTNNLTREKMQQILAAVGPQRAVDDTQIDTAEYDWHQPHYFSNYQLKELDSLTEKVADAITKKFAELCRTDFNVTIDSTTQHFADKFLEQLSSDQPQHTKNYYLAFGADQEPPSGLISIPSQTAITWTTQLLGDTESKENANRDLSQLEESLLLDVASSIVNAFSDAYVDFNFQPAKSIVKKQLPLELHGTEALCKITLKIKQVDSDNSSEAYILILCDKLEPALGKTSQADSKFSAEDISKVITDRLEQTSVSITAQLASTVFTFEEIMGLRPSDILLLDKKVDEPVELIIQGQTFFRGRPAKSAGRYAVVITEQTAH